MRRRSSSNISPGEEKAAWAKPCLACPGCTMCGIGWLVFLLSIWGFMPTGEFSGPTLPVFGAFAVRSQLYQQRQDGFNSAQAEFGTDR